MSRGFDWFELDDSSGSGFDSEREIGGGSSSNANERLWRQHIRREEERTDKLDRESRDRTDKERPQPPREERVQVILADRFRTRYFDEKGNIPCAIPRFTCFRRSVSFALSP